MEPNTSNTSKQETLVDTATACRLTLEDALDWPQFPPKLQRKFSPLLEMALTEFLRTDDLKAAVATFRRSVGISYENLAGAVDRRDDTAAAAPAPPAAAPQRMIAPARFSRVPTDDSGRHGQVLFETHDGVVVRAPRVAILGVPFFEEILEYEADCDAPIRIEINSTSFKHIVRLLRYGARAVQIDQLSENERLELVSDCDYLSVPDECWRHLVRVQDYLSPTADELWRQLEPGDHLPKQTKLRFQLTYSAPAQRNISLQLDHVATGIMTGFSKLTTRSHNAPTPLLHRLGDNPSRGPAQWPWFAMRDILDSSSVSVSHLKGMITYTRTQRFSIEGDNWVVDPNGVRDLMQILEDNQQVTFSQFTVEIEPK